MAQHIPLEQFEQKAIQAINASIRKRSSFSGSLLFEELRDADYKETPEDRVFICDRAVPESVVSYGRATIEVHTEPIEGKPAFIRQATNIYLVA